MDPDSDPDPQHWSTLVLKIHKMIGKMRVEHSSLRRLEFVPKTSIKNAVQNSIS